MAQNKNCFVIVLCVDKMHREENMRFCLLFLCKKTKTKKQLNSENRGHHCEDAELEVWFSFELWMNQHLAEHLTGSNDSKTWFSLTSESCKLEKVLDCKWLRFQSLLCFHSQTMIIYPNLNRYQIICLEGVMLLPNAERRSASFHRWNETDERYWRVSTSAAPKSSAPGL